jgi:hypothetical protein
VPYLRRPPHSIFTDSVIRRYLLNVRIAPEIGRGADIGEVHDQLERGPRLPAPGAVTAWWRVYQWPEWAEEGGLIGYGPRIVQLYRDVMSRQLATLLRGTKPADLPVESGSDRHSGHATTKVALFEAGLDAGSLNRDTGRAA